MARTRAWFARAAGIFRRHRCDRDLADELNSHLDAHIAENIRASMTPDDARRDALLKLGGVFQTTEAYRARPAFRLWRPPCRTFDTRCGC
jgi:hypothetical protein